jgi:arginyl-tRNA synthetase
MSDQFASSHLKVLFEAALLDYESQTGIALAKYPLAERLQECHSVESITTFLHEQTKTFNEFRGKEKIMKSLKNSVSILCRLSVCAKLEQVIGMVLYIRKHSRVFHTSDLIP